MMEPDEIETTRILKDVATRIKEEQCVIFLGAGVHAPPPEGCDYSYPEEYRPLLGRDLAAKLADVCQCKQLCPKNPCSDLQRISLCMETSRGLGRNMLVNCLSQYLKTGRRASPILEMLARLTCSIFVTTNYDGLFESVLRKLDKEPSVIVYNPQLGGRTGDMTRDPTPERPLLFKMHGDLNNRESIVITDEDYINFIQRMSETGALHPLPATVSFRMQKWPTLFVGYSLRDVNLRLIFRTLRWETDPANRQPLFSVDVHPDPLLLRVYQDERHFVTFVTEDIWTFVPRLFKEVTGEEYNE